MENETKTARERAEALFNEHGVGWRGYDGENLMSLVVEFMEPELLREMMRLYKEKGYDPVAALQKGDNDGITGMSMALDVPDLLPVLEEFGVERFRPKLLPAIPAESSDVYDVYKAEVADGTWAKREMIQALASAAYDLHKAGKTPYRHAPDGRPYIVHPQAVVKLLEKWGYNEAADFVTIAVGWGHDLIEETVDAAATEAAIRKAVFADQGLADEVVAGIRKLSFNPPPKDKTKTKEENCAIYEAVKKDYILNIARTAPINVLVVKMADRLCNTMDFLKAGNPWAKNYLEQGRCLFERMGEAKRPDLIGESLNEAQFGIAKMMLGGNDEEEAYEALEALRRWAADGNNEAAVLAGDVFVEGALTPQNLKEAERLFRQASDRGDDVARQRIESIGTR